MNNVLLVEDDHAISTALARRLTACGYQVHQAYDAVTATMALRKNNPDVALLDINMPAGNAFVLAERMKALPTSIPYIFMTASNEQGLRQRALDAGATAFLQKPFSAQDLMDALDQTMHA
jgi:CheY-like chemotaxis protein